MDFDNTSKNNSNTDLTKNANLICQMAVSELMNGRYFFIPSYQRGYRWSKTQIYDLCNDLLDYALKKEQEQQNLIQNKSFYCLQPIIVIPRRFTIEGDGSHEGFEVVDGQQRLTSMYILYRYLANAENNLSLLPLDSSAKKTIVESKYGKQLYHIYYETRPQDYQTIEKVGFENLKDTDIQDIDIAHISNAYQYIDQWFDDKDEGAPVILNRYPLSEKKSRTDVVECLRKLIHADKNSKNGSVQVIWYELEPNKDAVKEFIKENTGKIKLTDTELIKGLFLQKRNFGKEVGALQQLSIGKDWELIENTLHHNDFWSFLSNNIHQEDNRINIVFEYIYQKHHNGAPLPKNPQNSLFRFYNNYFETHFSDANGGMHKLWGEVMECFQTLQNWYNNPYIYNLVGLLAKNGMKLYEINQIFEDPAVVSTDDFLWKLKENILAILPSPIVNEDVESIFPNRYFALFYGVNDQEIKNLLRFVNVRQLCIQLDQARKAIESKEKKSDANRTDQDLMNHIYKFPYDVLDSFNWDVEHIDSATTNELKTTEDKEKWIEEAIKVLKEKITNNSDYLVLDNKLKAEPNRRDENLIEIIKQINCIVGGDLEDGKEKKNWIGNLTLLDCGTNREYKNALFAKKHEKIEERVKKGVFVPTCTQNVFDKKFDGCTKEFWRWDWNDKCQHHKFLLKEYDDFEKEVIDHKNTLKNQMIGEEDGNE